MFVGFFLIHGAFMNKDRCEGFDDYEDKVLKNF